MCDSAGLELELHAGCEWELGWCHQVLKRAVCGGVTSWLHREGNSKLSMVLPRATW
jgi:hypothetical protein